MPHWDSDQDKRSNQVIQQCVSVQQCARPITAGARSCGRLDGALRRVSSLCPVTHATKWHSLRARMPREQKSGLCRYWDRWESLGTAHQEPSEHSKVILCPGLDRVMVSALRPRLLRRSKTGAPLARPRESGGETVMMGCQTGWSAASNMLRQRNSRDCAKHWSVQTGRGRR